MTHPILNLVLLGVLALCVGLMLGDLEENWDKIIDALKGRGVR